MNEHLSYEALQKAYNDQLVRYDELINTSPAGILILKPIQNEGGTIVDFAITHCNRAVHLLGHFPSNATDYTLLQLLPHLNESDQFNVHQYVAETGEPTQFETTFRDKDGTEYGWFIVSLNKLHDVIISRFVDISEKKAVEKKMANQAAFYNSILESSINGVFVCRAEKNASGVTVDFIVTNVNKAFREITEKTTEQVIGASYLDFYPEAIQSGMFAMFCQVLISGEPVRKDIQLPIGTNNWFDISIGKIDDEHVTISFNNITRRIKAFAEVEQQRNLLNSILQNSPGGIMVTVIIKDETGQMTDARIILANEASEIFTGISKEDAIQKTVLELDPNLMHSGLFEKTTETLKTGVPFSTQYYYEPQKKWLEIGVSKMDENHLVNIFIDITETKNTQLTLERLVDELKRTNANLEEFTYAASHDLKEPIRKIRIFADRLKEEFSGAMNNEGLKILDRLVTSSLRMRLLVDDLLEYSQVSLFKSIPEAIDLNKKLAMVLADVDLEMEEKQAIINIATLPTISGHSRQLQQLFQNIISNALKYSKTDRQPVIHISADQVKGHEISQQMNAGDEQKDFYKIEITDNGIGFEQKYADKIFRVFQRLHTRTDYPGSGIGLSIVKKVIENHHGYITVMSQPDVGSVFSIYLPV